MQVTQEEAKDLPKLRQEWHREVLGYFDQLGSCHYPAILSGILLSRVRIFVGVREPSGEITESEDAKELALLDPLADAGGGHRGLLSKYGTLRFLTGEQSLVNSLDADEKERWELLSPIEFRVSGDGRSYVRQEYPGKTIRLRDASAKPLDQTLEPDEARVWRLWRQHPTFSGLSDAPTRAVRGLYEEMAYLSLGARSRVLSRLIRSGILFYAGEISFASMTPQDPDEDPESDPVFAELIKHIVAAISDPGSAAAIAPLLARIDTGGRPIQDLFYHLQLGDSAEAYPESERQQEVLKQIAVGIDFPPEVLEGIGGLNHWGAWLANQETWETHGDPDMIAFSSDFTAAYLRPLAEARGLTRAKDLVIGYDAAGAVTDPDKAKTVRQAYVDGVASGEAYREAIDLDDSAKPTEEEHQEFLARTLRAPALLPGAEVPAPTPAADAQQPPDTIRSEPPGGMPTEPPPAMTAASKGHLHAAVVGAGLTALVRARELAGSRIRSRRDSCPDCFEGMDDVANEDLAAELGAATLKKIKAPAGDELVRGCSRGFTSALVRLGIDADVAVQLGTRLSTFAAETLTDPAPELPDDFAEGL